jgi:nitrous oxide reductase
MLPAMKLDRQEAIAMANDRANHRPSRGLTRRSLIKTAAIAGAAWATGVGPALVPRPARAAAKKLKILQ